MGVIHMISIQSENEGEDSEIPSEEILIDPKMQKSYQNPQ